MNMINFTYDIIDELFASCTLNSKDFNITLYITDLDELDQVTPESFYIDLRQDWGRRAETILRILLNKSDNKLIFSMNNSQNLVKSSHQLSDANANYLIDAVYNFKSELELSELFLQGRK